MNTIEVNEQEYLALIEQKNKLQERVDRLELFFYGVLRQADKMIKEGVDVGETI